VHFLIHRYTLSDPSRSLGPRGGGGGGGPRGGDGFFFTPVAGRDVYYAPHFPAHPAVHDQRIVDPEIRERHLRGLAEQRARNARSIGAIEAESIEESTRAQRRLMQRSAGQLPLGAWTEGPVFFLKNVL
jgi:hypothetical protein